MANTREKQDFRDWQSRFDGVTGQPIKARGPGGTWVDRSLWDQFVTTAEAAKIEAAIEKARIPFTVHIDPTLTVEKEEKRTPFIYTLTMPSGVSQEFDAGMILAVLWENQIDEPGTLYFDGDTLKFRPDPKSTAVPTPAPLVAPPGYHVVNTLTGPAFIKDSVLGLSDAQKSSLLTMFAKMLEG